jgi:hypothetical protein
VALKLLQRSRKPELDAVQQQALEDLRRDGVAIVPFDELYGDALSRPELEREMQAFVDDTERQLTTLDRDERKARYGKSFLVRRYRPQKGQPRTSLASDNPWVRMGISPRLLDVVTAYRGTKLRLHDVDNWYTVPEADAEARVASQRWHRDGWENHIVKVFTYFNDVDEEAGPFEYVRGSAEGGKYGALWPWEDEEVYPDQDEFETKVAAEDRTVLTGGPGTVIICDTSGFHRGGFARTRPRILAYHTFLSDEGNRRHKRKFDVEWSNGAELPEQSRFALE